MRHILAAVFAASIAMPMPAHAQTAEAEQPVAVVVAIPTPSSIPRPAIEAGMRKSVPQYRALPGLLRKYYTIGTDNFGGIYLFKSRAAAQAWFNDAWVARVRTTYGAPATITYFDVPLALDNAGIPAAATPAP